MGAARKPNLVLFLPDQQRADTVCCYGDMKVHAPNLNSVGFALVGGRLVAGNERPGALFMYENADKQRISLLVRKDAEPARETAFRYALEDGVGVFYWIDDSCGYALSGNLDKLQLLSIARIVYGQLAAAEASAPKP